MPVLVAGCRPSQAAYDADINILTIGRFAETMAAVRSALRQSDLTLHVTVLDQGSSPETRQLFAAAFAAMDHVSYFTVEHNLGVGGGRNLAAELGHGDVIIGLDNDAVFEDGAVARKVIEEFAGAPELGAIAFRIMAADGATLDHFSWGYPARLKPRFRERFDTTTFVGAGHAIRRAAWAQAGGYDAALFFTWEEYDFCLRVISMNWLVRYDGSLGAIHKVAPEARVEWTDARARYFVRNRLIIGRKWGASWLSLIPRIGGYLFKAVLSGRFAPTLAGVAEAIQGDTNGRRGAMTLRMRRYYQRNENLHRGSLWQRLRDEVFARGNKGPAG
jgi:GT2 family glycosyltransferase